MATTPNSIITIQTPKMDFVQFSTADTPGVNKTLAQGVTNGSKIVGLYANNSDSTAHLVTINVQRSGVNYGGVAVSVPLNSGFANGVPPVNLMSTANWPGLPVDSDGNPFIFLQSTLDLIVATYGTAISTGISAVVNGQAVRGDF